MSFPKASLTNEQWDLIAAVDDAIEHCHFEIDADDYRGPSTCGFASIVDVDGRRKFMRRLKANLEADRHNFSNATTGVGEIHMGGFRIVITEDYQGGYRVSIAQQNILGGPDIQRLDFQERLHREFLNRMRYNGYLEEARLRSRMD